MEQRTEYQSNRALLDYNEVSMKDQATLQAVGQRLYDILFEPEKHGTPREVVDLVNGYETVLQNLWGFPYNPNMFRYQHRINGCLCPKLDNNELVGSEDLFIKDSTCPYHGEGVTPNE